jgi:hypothetical protein
MLPMAGSSHQRTVDKPRVSRSGVCNGTLFGSRGDGWHDPMMTRSGFLKWLIGIFGAVSVAGIV